MKNVKKILFGGAFALTLIGTFASNAFEMPAPYYGVNPATGLCELGTLVEPAAQCTAVVTPVRCTVTFANNNTAPAFDDKPGTTCVQPLFVVR